jgi:hypothetical protein
MKIQEQIPFLFHFSTPLATPKQQPITNSPLTTNNKSTKPNLIEGNSKQLSQVES